jgi:hypothetical protein
MMAKLRKPPQTSSARITRTTSALFEALDQQQYLLRRSLHELNRDQAHLRTLAVCLRTLVCLSSGTEGLLWRLVDQTNVSDEIDLVAGGQVDRDHPIARGLAVWTVPLRRPGDARPGLPQPRSLHLRRVIKDHEAIYVASLQDVVYTHELLIGAVAGQMAAHEAPGLDYRLTQLSTFLVNQQPLYTPVLAFDAELTLQICDRALDYAERAGLYHRAQREPAHGDVTILVRFALKQHAIGSVPIVTFRSAISEIELSAFARPRSMAFEFVKRGDQLAELVLPYPVGWSLYQDAVFVLSYSSNQRKVRTIVNDVANTEPAVCDAGWLNGREVGRPERHEVSQDIVALRSAVIYSRLLSPGECGELLRLSHEDMCALMEQEASSAHSQFPP